MKKLIILPFLSIYLLGYDISSEIDKINSNLPQKIDNITTFEKATYNKNENSITFIKKVDDSIQNVQDIMKNSELWPKLKMKIAINEIFINCKNSAMKQFFNKGGKLDIEYIGKNSKIFSILVDKDKCKMLSSQ